MTSLLKKDGLPLSVAQKRDSAAHEVLVNDRYLYRRPSARMEKKKRARRLHARCE